MTQDIARDLRHTGRFTGLQLRPEVTIGFEASSVTVGFAMWEVEVPASVLEDSAGLTRLLRDRRIGTDETFDAPARALVTLLDAQGCFLPEPASDSLADALAAFLPLRSVMYADYYSHPLWTRLRDGAATAGELTTWAVHNYHVSRSAGAIAARRSVRSHDDGLQPFFREDALEEYWHCDAFYFVDGPGVTLPADQVKRYVPLPASTAFEDLALRTAEEDAVGHLLIAFYQESSILFQGDCEDFYDSVERHYGISGFFAGWRQHMGLDIDEGHADNLRGLFAADKHVDPTAFRRSVRRVQLAAFYLRAALDQACRYVTDDPLEALSARSPEAVRASDPASMSAAGSSRRSAQVGQAWLNALHEASFECLAFARDHDAIIGAGRLAEALEKQTRPPDGGDRLPEGPWAAAVRNFLVERGRDWEAFSVLAHSLVDAAVSVWPESSEWEALRRRLNKIVEPPGDETTVDAARLMELLRLSLSGAELPHFTLVASGSDGSR